MAVRAPWQDTYGIVLQTAGITTARTFVAGNIGVGPDQYAIPLLDHPDISQLHRHRNVRFSDGLPDARTYGIGDAAITLDHSTVEFTLRCEATIPLLGMFTWLLFQNGVTEDAGAPYQKSANQYTSSDVEVWASVIRLMTTSPHAAQSHLASGCICRELKLKGSAGGAWELEAMMIGRNVNVAHDFDAQSSILDFRGTDPVLLFQNSALRLPALQNRFESAEITLSNNARPIWYDSNLCDRFSLGNLDVSVAWTTPWDSAGGGTSWKSQQAVQGVNSNYLQLDIGEAATQLRMEFEVVDVSIVGGDETMVQVAARRVRTGPVDSFFDIVLLLSDGVDRGIP